MSATKKTSKGTFVDESDLDVKLKDLENKIDLIMKTMKRADASVFDWAKGDSKNAT